MATDATRRIQSARTALILDQPFFGALAVRLTLQESTAQPTFWTDGRVLGYNPEYVATLTPAQIQGIICHEVLHVANGHPWRSDGREHARWNQACDYAINPIVVDAGMALPDGALLNPAFAGLSAEAIFSRLPEPQPQGEGEGQGEGQTGQQGQTGAPGAGCGEVLPAPQDGSTSEAEWQVATIQAAQAAKAMGKLPAGLDRLIDRIKRPAVDWRSALRRFVQETARADYTWKAPNTRYLASGLYLPSLRSEQMGALVVAVDTSGSISPEDLAQFAGEIQAVADECQPESIHVVYCDSRVNKAEEFAAGDQISLTPCGGGGTAFEPVFEHVAQQGITPACMVYLTDLEGSFPQAAPDYPVLWAVFNDYRRPAAAPFGETLFAKAGQ